jgi:hypothetical protein
MGELSERERAAVEVVARRFAATWAPGDEGSPDAYLTIAGERIAVEVAVIAPGRAQRDERARPRLRFDRVVLRLVGGLQAALSGAVPDGEAVLLTVTAPIRLPAKTATALETTIRDGLAHGSPPAEVRETIHGNQVRVRFVQGVSRRTSKLIGFVHNPDPDPEVLLDLTQALLQPIGAAADRRPPEAFTGDRWLVIVDPDGRLDIETWRQVYTQLALSSDFKERLLVTARGRVEPLTAVVRPMAPP